MFGVMCFVAVAFCVQCSTDSGEYVDLGLPSGTKWKTTNETNPNDEYDFYTYGEAVEKFGEQLPTKEQFQELIDNCTWSWDDTKKGCLVVGTNGNSIFLQAAGVRNCDGDEYFLESFGGYWSSTDDGSDKAWNLSFLFLAGIFDKANANGDWCFGRSVRLVQK